MAVFNERDNHSFCHHEILITAYPLALEWLDFDPGEPDEKGEWDVHIGLLLKCYNKDIFQKYDVLR